MRTSALFGAKFQIFRNLCCVRTNKGVGVEPVWTFCGQGGRVWHFFAILCVRHLWTLYTMWGIGAGHKIRPHSAVRWEGAFLLQTRELFKYRRPSRPLLQKKLRLWKLWCVRTNKRKDDQDNADIFRTRGERRHVFAISMSTSVMVSPLRK